uniref:Uncharacterized protein n=1 Tax=Vitis vinifera TaxID=29760 RepID=A5C824_VITVI|nr:hypothetical protein VITISV_043135 [Vitis vinifera]
MDFGRQLHQAEGQFRTPLFKVRNPQSTVREFRTPQIKVVGVHKWFLKPRLCLKSLRITLTGQYMEISKLSNSGSTRVDGSSAVGGGAFNDLDPLDGLGKFAFPSEMNKRGKNRSPSSTEPTSETQTFATKEPIEKSSVEGQDSHSQKKMPAENYWESLQTLFDIPTVSTDSHKSFSQTPSPPSHCSTTFKTPAPRPTQVSRAETGSFGSNNARKKVNEFSSFANSSQYSQSPKLTRGTMKSSAVSQIDELEDFAMGRTRNNVDGHAEGLYGDEFETNSVAAASTAPMKEAKCKSF